MLMLPVSLWSYFLSEYTPDPADSQKAGKSFLSKVDMQDLDFVRQFDVDWLTHF